jgi:hypothetical protein
LVFEILRFLLLFLNTNFMLATAGTSGDAALLAHILLALILLLLLGLVLLWLLLLLVPLAIALRGDGLIIVRGVPILTHIVVRIEAGLLLLGDNLGQVGGFHTLGDEGHLDVLRAASHVSLALWPAFADAAKLSWWMEYWL